LLIVFNLLNFRYINNLNILDEIIKRRPTAFWRSARSGPRGATPAGQSPTSSGRTAPGRARTPLRPVREVFAEFYFVCLKLVFYEKLQKIKKKIISK
jgi:hypothetical protein